MVQHHLDPDLRANTSIALGELSIALAEQALDLLAAADREARLSELGALLDAASDAHRLWVRLATEDQT